MENVHTMRGQVMKHPQDTIREELLSVEGKCDKHWNSYLWRIEDGEPWRCFECLIDKVQELIYRHADLT